MSNNNRKSSKIASENDSDYNDEVMHLFRDKEGKLHVTKNDVELEKRSNENNVTLLQLEIDNKSEKSIDHKTITQVNLESNFSENSNVDFNYHNRGVSVNLSLRNVGNLVSEDYNNFINNGTTIDSTIDRHLKLLSNISKGFNDDGMFINNENTMNTNIGETSNLIIDNQESIVDNEDKVKFQEEYTSANINKIFTDTNIRKDSENQENKTHLSLETRHPNNNNNVDLDFGEKLYDNSMKDQSKTKSTYEYNDNENKGKSEGNCSTTHENRISMNTEYQLKNSYLYDELNRQEIIENGDNSESESGIKNKANRLISSLFQIFIRIPKDGIKVLWKYHFSIKDDNKELSIKTDKFTKYEKHPKPGGLRNSQSTCYMNAMIQALSSSDFLLQTLESLAKTHSNSSISLLYNLLNAINEPNKNNETLMRNTNLLEDLIKSVGWTKPSQQDAFDLLAALITDICKQSNNSDKIEIPLRIKLLHEFQGINISNRIQEHLGLSLNLSGNYGNRPGVLLQFLINNHFLPTAIDGDQSKLTKLSLYREIPNILLIHIQANKWDPISCQMIKPIYYIQYDENMTLWFDIVNEINGENRNLNEDRICSTEVQYHLKSIVYHVGNISRGHYVAYKLWRNEWYLANDESIRKASLNDIISPYIMIYERQL